MGTQFIKGLANFLKLSGGTMTGDIDMGDNDISEVKSIAFQDGGATVTQVTNSDSLGTSDTVLCTQGNVKAYVDATAIPTSNAYSTTLIKVMPTEFMLDDAYTRSSHILDNDTADTLGYRHPHADSVSHAFVHIPNGYKATRCQVRASASTAAAVTCFTYNLQSGIIAALASGDFDFNENENITDVTATTTNDLVIRITPASTSTLIFGAEVAIAAV